MMSVLLSADWPRCLLLECITSLYLNIMLNLFKITCFYFMYWKFFLHACLYTTYMQCLQRPEKGLRASGTEGELPFGFWELNPYLLEEKPGLLIPEPSF